MISLYAEKDILFDSSFIMHIKNSSAINILLADLICWDREFSQVWAYYETFLILSRISNSKLNHYRYVPNSTILCN